VEYVRLASETTAATVYRTSPGVVPGSSQQRLAVFGDNTPEAEGSLDELLLVVETLGPRESRRARRVPQGGAESKEKQPDDARYGPRHQLQRTTKR
jgi:hypothetical protein